MRQSRLESYFGVPRRNPSPTRCPFTDLPPSIRCLIYEYAGPAGQTIDLNFSNLLVYRYKQYPDLTFAVRPRCVHSYFTVVRGRDTTAPIGETEYWEESGEWEAESLCTEGHPSCSDGRSLLFVCKSVYKEVVSFIYSRNIFTVRQGAPHGLKRVARMGVDGMTALTSLTIKLDTNDKPSCLSYGYSNEKAPRLLYLNRAHMRTIIREYEGIIERLAKHVTPRNLAFYLIFRVSGLDVLQKVLQQLSQLPTLKECGIWTFVGLQTPSWVSLC
jgi:hypothetical protein